MYIDISKDERVVLNAGKADFSNYSMGVQYNINFTTMTPLDCYKMVVQRPNQGYYHVLYGNIEMSTGTFAAAPDDYVLAPCETHVLSWTGWNYITVFQIIKYYKPDYSPYSMNLIDGYTEYWRTNVSESSWGEWNIGAAPMIQAGDATTPIYINGDGQPTACRYQLNETVPKDAKFTDTTYNIATTSVAGLVKSGTDITVSSAGSVTVPHISTNSIGASGGTFDLNTFYEAGKFKFWNLSSNGTYENAPDGTSKTRIGLYCYPISSSAFTQEAFVNGKKYFRVSTNSSTADPVVWANWQIMPSIPNGTSIGGTITPIYYSASSKTFKPCTYTLGASVPSNAKFTDTTYSGEKGITLNNGKFGHSNSITAKTTNNQTTTTLASQSSFKVTEPLYDAQGHITGTNVATITIPKIVSTEATQSAAGLMSAADKKKLDGVTDSADAVSFTQSLTAGTQVGIITINGTATKLYAPTNTDTHYTTGLKVANSATATANAAASNGSVYLNALDNTTVRDSHLIKGTGATTVTSDANGVITINSTNTTYSGEKGISLNGTKLGHSNAKITKGSVGAAQTPSFGGTFAIPKITYDDYGHITAATTVNVTLPKADTDGFLPLTAGESKKLTGPLGLTSVMYGPTLPTSGFNGQLFFLEDSGAALPTGGSAGQALVKNTATDGDASWKSSSISWAAGTSNGPQPKIFGVTGSAIPAASASASGVVTTGSQIFAGNKTFNSTITVGSITVKAQDSSHEGGEIVLSPATSSYKTGHIDLYDNKIRYHDGTSEYFTVDLGTGEARAQKLYGAVWNDYAEFRAQKEIIEPGYCVASSNNGQVYKTTEKFQACDGIVSDTFGFAIGEADECKTPLAVAGRVLAYFHGNREDYQAGDTVCAGSEGKVIKMTREEVKEYPDRIIGIVSEIPEYETWGSGNVAVNGRIWIKVR